MSVLNNIRSFVAMRKLKGFSQKRRQESMKAFAQARSVGLIYNVEKISWKTVTKLIHYFESHGKSVTTIGFFDEKELNHNYSPNYKHLFFCQRELNFWKIPKPEDLRQFVSTDFDYLINLDVEGELVLQALSAYSNARTRIGLHLERFEFCQDFMIKTEVQDGPQLFEQIIKYIK